MMERIWEQFDRVVVFDTETTGIEFGKDRMIELGAVSLEDRREIDCMDLLIRLPEGQALPPFITDLTGITDIQLLAEGVEQSEAVEAFCGLLAGAERPLLVAYNAQFDLNFLYHFLRPYHRVDVLRLPRFLDALTVYKDRRDYPHKLCNAIDARATVALLEAMAAERDDLDRYLDLFGVHPKYGASGRKISSVTYRTQPYQRIRPLYEQT